MAENPNRPELPVFNPATSFVFSEPVVYDPEDNESYANKTTIPVLRASGTHENEMCGLWNATRCGNDDAFCMPVVGGDKIYLQLIINDPVPTPYTLQAYGIDGEAITAPGAINTYRVRDKENGNNYLNIVINTDLISADCFYFALSGSTCSPGYEYCYTLPPEQVQNCLDGHCTNETILYSDMYCKIDPDCVDTLVVEGDYGDGYDCDDNFYGIPLGGSAAQQFKLKFRVPATIERREYNFTETVLNGSKIKSTQTESWLFRTDKIPPYVVELLAKAFNSKQLTIDGVDYKRALKLTKNFDEGRMWIVSETLVTDCDEINFSCTD